MDTRMRSICKAVTFRITSIIVLLIVSYAVTGSVRKMAGITVIFQVIIAVLYYLHERVWNRIFWGKHK
jgi:uncharacterized membrane protein